MLEDNVADAELIKFALREGGLLFSLARVDSKTAFLREVEQNTPDIILLDYSLPSFDGLSALHIAQKSFPNIPFIFVTGTLGEEVVIEMLKSGATDYVLKNRLSRLVPAVLRALGEKEAREERHHAEERLRKSHEQLRALSVYLQYVREDERIRISRQVHDELGQALTGLKLDLYWLATRLPKELKSIQKKAKTMSAHIDTTIQTVRRISTELRPGILDDLGLSAALEWQAQEFQKRTGIKCLVVTDVKQPIMDEELNTAFFRIFQETLTNVIRHAQATRVEVSLRKTGRSLQLQVQDNGRGILEHEMNDTKSIGLLGMRERAALLGGTLHLKGTPGGGTTVTVKIPIARPKEIEIAYHENTHRG
ncbi:MAG: Response regulator receiver sensor signal transduction histidine kinase [Verrucomicrobiales bacterium]|nr:Response regulator receiver sensor signal transduction histidine kinase [Verrucomicrobiales bacterium]